MSATILAGSLVAAQIMLVLAMAATAYRMIRGPAPRTASWPSTPST